MREVRQIEEPDFKAFTDIFLNAYPGIDISTQEEKNRLTDRFKQTIDDPDRSLVGLYDDDQLLGGMILYHFEMTYHAVKLRAGGVGQLAVDLLHKKRHVAKELMTFFLEQCRQQQIPLALLYPFRPDFYKQMGFGFGTKKSSYRFRPAALSRTDKDSHSRFLTPADTDALLSCYRRHAVNTHGLLERPRRTVEALFDNNSLNAVGHFRDSSCSPESLDGYLIFKFENRSNFLDNELHVRELIFDNEQALRGLLAFLQTQLDQISWIQFDTYDENFHHLLNDPRNSSGNLIPSVFHESNVQGVGLMYRVVDVTEMIQALREHNFNGQSCDLGLVVEDSFCPHNNSTFRLCIVDGYISDYKEHDPEVTIFIEISDLSTLLMGVVGFETLAGYGRVELSDPGYLELLTRVFHSPVKPICMTSF